MTPMFASSGLFMLLVMVAVFLVFSTLMQRPLKKQAAQQAELRRSVTEGDRILLTSGIFASVTHVGDAQLICEIAPGVEITVLKDAIKKVVTPDEEEFEYADSEAVEPTVSPTSPGDAQDLDPAGDAGAMGNAATGTEGSLGMPTQDELRPDPFRPTDS